MPGPLKMSSRARRAPRARVAALCAAALLALAVAISVAGCGEVTRSTGGRLAVAVSVPPQKYFVERIAGSLVAVTAMVAPGVEPHTYEPKPEDLRRLADAAVYFTVGLPFEEIWMDRFKSANPDLEVVDTSVGITKSVLPDHGHESGAGGGEDGGAAGSGATEELDPHTWTSPALVKIEARSITDTLVRLDPAHASDYEGNLAAFLSDIDALDTDIRSTLTGSEGAKFIVFHPAWGYFARDYGLIQVPVEVEGQEPSAAELANLIAEAKAEGITVVFAQPELSTRSAQTLAKEIGGSVVLISPLAEDWLGNMLRLAHELSAAFAKT